MFDTNLTGCQFYHQVVTKTEFIEALKSIKSIGFRRHDVRRLTRRADLPDTTVFINPIIIAEGVVVVSGTTDMYPTTRVPLSADHYRFPAFTTIPRDGTRLPVGVHLWSAAVRLCRNNIGLVHLCIQICTSGTYL